MSEGTCMSVNLFDEVGYVQGLRASLTDLYQKPDDEQTKAEINNLIQQIRNYEEIWSNNLNTFTNSYWFIWFIVINIHISYIDNKVSI